MIPANLNRASGFRALSKREGPEPQTLRTTWLPIE